jgi:8-oxo-dGTP pyrophosphatase MutT (NUDIX family)
MAQSNHPTTNHPSTHFLESAGCIQFIPSTPPKVIVVHHAQRDPKQGGAYLLAKGRRNINESRAKCALRETMEETGLKCRLLSIRLQSRQCPQLAEGEVEEGFTEDKVRVYDDTQEPFMLTERRLESGLKLIWWYIAVVEEQQPGGLKAEEGLTATPLEFDKAVKELKYECDRDVLRAAVKIYEENMRLKELE